MRSVEWAKVKSGSTDKKYDAWRGSYSERQRTPTKMARGWSANTQGWNRFTVHPAKLKPSKDASLADDKIEFYAGCDFFLSLQI